MLHHFFALMCRAFLLSSKSLQVLLPDDHVWVSLSFFSLTFGFY